MVHFWNGELWLWGGIFFNEQQMHVHDEDVVVQYISVLNDICLLNYGPISTPIIFMWCKWVCNGIDLMENPTYQRDEGGFLLANFCHIWQIMKNDSFFHFKHNKCFLWSKTIIHNGKLYCIKNLDLLIVQWI
jgi:hypothetical protein